MNCNNCGCSASFIYEPGVGDMWALHIECNGCGDRTENILVRSLVRPAVYDVQKHLRTKWERRLATWKPLMQRAGRFWTA